MLKITQFESALVELVPETQALLFEGGLCVHEAVDRVTLHGSRGLQGGARADSDLDLCLVINSLDMERDDLDTFLRSVLNTTLENWQNKIELDLAVVFDRSGCGLKCLNHEEFVAGLCPSTVDCMGLFKIQKGFNGFVTGDSVDCSKMYPLMTIWRRDGR